MKRATELLTALLEQLVEGQQLDLHMAAASSAAAAQARADLPEYTAEWDSQAEVHPLRAIWPAAPGSPHLQESFCWQ